MRAAEDVLTIYWHSVFAQRIAIAAQPVQCGADVGAPDVGDPLASLIDEVLRCQLAGQYIICSDEVRGQSLESAVDKNVLLLLTFDTAKALNPPLCGCDEKNIEPAG